MLFGTDVDQLHAALARHAEGGRFNDDPGWSRLWQSLKERGGQQAALWALGRLDQTLEPAYHAALSDDEDDEQGLAALLWRVLLFGTAERSAGIPYAAAPPFERLRFALPLTGAVMTQSADGWSITVGALRGSRSF